MQSAQALLKYVVTNLEELNLIKNDICFLISDIFEGKSNDPELPLEQGTFFYIWMYLEFQDEHDKKCQNLFPFDLFFVRKKVSAKHRALIQKVLKSQTDVYIFTRRLGEKKEFSVDVFK
jgi:hypothetical protein